MHNVQQFACSPEACTAANDVGYSGIRQDYNHFHYFTFESSHRTNFHDDNSSKIHTSVSKFLTLSSSVKKKGASVLVEVHYFKRTNVLRAQLWYYDLICVNVLKLLN